MGTLTSCVIKAGKLLSKSDVKTLQASHTKYLKAGMSPIEATQKAVEDFVLGTHNKVVDYEAEIKAKGGDPGLVSFDLTSAVLKAKKEAGAKGEPLKGIEDTQGFKDSPQNQLWGENLEAPEIEADLKEAVADLKAEVARGELELSTKDMQDIEQLAKDKAIGPIGLRMIAHNQSGYIGLTGGRRTAKNDNGSPSTEAFVIDKLTRAKTQLRQSLVDQFASYNSILKDPESWMLANLTASAPGALEQTIYSGAPFLDSEGVVGIDTETKGLLDVLAPLGTKKSEDFNAEEQELVSSKFAGKAEATLLNRFTYYIAGHRAEKLFAEGRENAFSEEDIKVLKNMNRGNEALFEKVRKDFEELNNAPTQMAVDAGLISAEEADQWRDEGFYLPFYRIVDEGETSRGPRISGNPGLARQQAYKKLKGGTQKLDDLMVNAVSNWSHLISASLKNQAGNRAMASAVKLGVAHRTTKEAASKHAVYLRQKGREVWYEVDEPLVLASFNALNWEGLNGPAMKVMRSFKRALTLGITASPEFKVANLVRDSVSALAATDVSTNLAKNLAHGWSATKKGTPTEIAMVAAGATFDQGHIHGSDPVATQKLIKKGIKPKTVIDSAGKWVNVWRHYQDLGARMENINRAADYVQTLARGEGTLKAAFNARDHLDFTRTGSAVWVRAMSQTVPFLNARLQGIDKLARAAPGSFKQLVSMKEYAKFKTVMATYSLAAIGMYLAIKDDDDYQQVEEWEKRTYHHFKIPGADGLFRIPRPFEVGALAFMAESFVHTLVDDEVHGELFAERMVDTLSETFSFNPIPQIAKPAIEMAANRSFFTGRSIESPYLHISDLSPAKRKRVWTSETAIQVAKGLDRVNWDKVKLSPIQIEHLVQGYFGWAGATILTGIDMLVTRPLTDSPTQPPTKLSEYPVIKRFMTTLPLRNTKNTSGFYDTLNEINNVYTDIRDAKKMRDFEEVERLLVDKGDLLPLRNFYVKQQKRLSKINKRMNLIKGSNMEPVAKGRELDRLTVFKNAMTKQIARETSRFKKSRK